MLAAPALSRFLRRCWLPAPSALPVCSQCLPGGSDGTEIPLTDYSSSNSESLIPWLRGHDQGYGFDFLVVSPACSKGDDAGAVSQRCTLNHPLQHTTFITLAGVNHGQLKRVSSSGRARWEKTCWPDPLLALAREQLLWQLPARDALKAMALPPVWLL